MAEGMSRLEINKKIESLMDLPIYGSTPRQLIQKQGIINEYEAKLKELQEIRDSFLKLHDELIGYYYEKDRRWHLIHGFGWPSKTNVARLDYTQLRVGSTVLSSKGRQGESVFHRFSEINPVKQCGKITPITRTYCGFCRLRSTEEGGAAIYLSHSRWDDWAEIEGEGDFDYLSEEISVDIRNLGESVSGRWWVTENATQRKDLAPELMDSITGAVDAEFHVDYSRQGVKACTTEKILINGYDLAKELRSHRGKYIHLEIDY